MSVQKTFGRKEITARSTEACVRYFADKNYSLYEEVGISKNKGSRADLVAFSMKGEIIITEIKSCWEDFATDTKWHTYLDYCNKMYFCIPEWLYNSDKGQFIVDECKKHKVGLLTLCCNFKDPITGKQKEPDVTVENGKKRLRVWLTNRVPARKRKVTGKNRRWLITKLAWRGGLCVANLKPSRGSVYLQDTYHFDASVSEHTFLYEFDPHEKEKYLKKFPKSSFKDRLKDPEIQMRIQKVQNRESIYEDTNKSISNKPAHRKGRKRKR